MAARTHAFAGVILDLHLPDIDGCIVMRELRLSPRTRHMPIIIASASLRHLQALSADDLALAQAVLVKPFGYDEFLSTISRVILAAAPAVKAESLAPAAVRAVVCGP